ncbi:DUF1405 domain-containing protein [Halomarina litorea]|uniref:DUF1405 domain-containing protein n=1 Tax=Halomarina litorea TaxID=2961595 RepID=UPI0020C33E80|nr:DUF1405 domain-containing protein [Halomarina sp. BCD28]
MYSPIPERWAQYYLGNAPSLVWLLLANIVAVLVGVRYYVETMPDVSTFAWPLYGDSPTAVFLGLLSLATLLPHLGKRVREAPLNRPLAYLHTLAFVWLVKYAVWTFLALNLRFSLYFPEVWAYFGILLTHLAFVGEAFLLPHYGATTRGALAFSLGALLLNDFVDYWLAGTVGCVLGSPEGRCDLYPPLRYDPGLALPVLTVCLSVACVALAAVVFDRLDAPGGRRPR